jgi:hypothetical protein
LFFYNQQMAGKKGRSGGSRSNAGGKRIGAGRKEGAIDIMPRERHSEPNVNGMTTRKWAYAEQALKHAARMLDILVEIAEDTEQAGSARVAAADKILDRALGKAPAHVDISAIRHTEIVYRSAEQIRQECLARGVPPILLDHMKLGSNGSDQGQAEIDGEATDVTPTAPQGNDGA